MKQTWREIHQKPAANESSPESHENEGRSPIQQNLLTKLDETQQAPVVPPPPPIVSPASREAKPKRAPKKLSKSELHKMTAIFAAIQGDLEGEEYCSHLDDCGVRIRQQWRDLGCPDSYTKAYRARATDPQWAAKMQDEKYRYRKKYEKMTKKDRESLIQGLERPPCSSKLTRPN
jgi:hypothetical protein